MSEETLVNQAKHLSMYIYLFIMTSLSKDKPMVIMIMMSQEMTSRSRHAESRAGYLINGQTNYRLVWLGAESSVSTQKQLECRFFSIELLHFSRFDWNFRPSGHYSNEIL